MVEKAAKQWVSGNASCLCLVLLFLCS